MALFSPLFSLVFSRHTSVTAKYAWVFTVLCVAVGAKVTCLAIDCVLPRWFPYEIGRSSSDSMDGLSVPAAVFSLLFFVFFGQKNKTVLMKGWRLLSGDSTGPGRTGSAQVDDCFYIFLLRRSLFFKILSQGKNLTVSAVSKVSSFGGDTSSYEFASLLATLLCHCKFTVGFKAFRGLHSNENSFTALLCWSIACLSGWGVWCSLLLCLSF